MLSFFRAYLHLLLDLCQCSPQICHSKTMPNCSFVEPNCQNSQFLNLQLPIYRIPTDGVRLRWVEMSIQEDPYSNCYKQMQINSVTGQQTSLGSSASFVLEKNDLLATIARYEHEALIQTKKIETLEGEVNRLIAENHELIRSIDNEKNEKMQMLEKQQAMTNHLALEGAEAHKYETHNKTITEENDRIRKELEQHKLQKTTLVRDKQNMANKLLVAESKLEALQMETEYLKASQSQLVSQNDRLLGENSDLSKKLQQISVSSVKTIIKDSDTTKEQLLQEFQNKINSKELASRQQAQRYEQKIGELNLKIAQLQAKLPSH